MILVAHPVGNANLRALLDALDRAGLLEHFITTIGWSKASYPALSDKIRGKLRRNYATSADKIDIHPWREIVRLAAGVIGADWLTQHESGWASMDEVWQSIDRHAACCLRKNAYKGARAVYAYEDCAEQIFIAASELGLRRVYDLPIAYWQTAQRLLREEAERYPDWEFSLEGTRDSEEKLARKTRELELAEMVICPSNFVLESLPAVERGSKKCLLAPFGSPDRGAANRPHASIPRPLRILFAGAMTQRKGLADVFAAMKMVKSKNVELVIMGSPMREVGWYRERFTNFIHEPPRPHAEVLDLMRSCDVLVLPSIVEGRALVQQEAMSCGLPLIVTKNAGGDDLIIEGETGFLVPIRSPQAIAEKIDWFSANRLALDGMGIAAQDRARQFTWAHYGETIVAELRLLLDK